MHAQQDPLDLLQSVRVKVVGSLDRLSQYMCTQTIDRAMYVPDPTEADRGPSHCEEVPGKRTSPKDYSDRVRLDVAVTSAGELYSWVGEKAFSDRSLLDLVEDGAISSGSFVSYLYDVFQNAGASFTYNGETAEGGRTLVEFGFRVPRDKSQYTYGREKNHVIFGYDGTFLVDRQTQDLVRLDIRVSDRDLLLPTAARLRILKVNGGEAENRTVFSSCHEFLGESTLSFAPSLNADASHQPADVAAPVLTVPPGLEFAVKVTQGIDAAMAAEGDLIKAKLASPIQDQSKYSLRQALQSRLGSCRSGNITATNPKLPSRLRWKRLNSTASRRFLPQHQK